MSAPETTAEEARACFDIAEPAGKKRKFKLSLSATELRLETEGEPPAVLKRSDPDRQKIQLLNGVFIRRMFVLELDKKKKLSLMLEPQVFEAVTAWLGPPTEADLKAALKLRLGWTLPIGLLYVFGSLPIAGNPATGFPPKPFDWIGFSLGAALVATAATSRMFPHRAYLVFDSLWVFGFVALNTANLAGGGSWWWLLLILLQFHIGCEGIREFRRLAPQTG